MITSGHKNKNWGDELAKENYAFKKANMLDIINNRFFPLLIFIKFQF